MNTEKDNKKDGNLPIFSVVGSTFSYSQIKQLLKLGLLIIYIYIYRIKIWK